MVSVEAIPVSIGEGGFERNVTGRFEDLFSITYQPAVGCYID